MKTPLLSQTLLRLAALTACAGALSSAAFGQTAPAPAVKTAAETAETVTLSPFVVLTEAEAGWSANDTLSATRTKQALKDVPVNIDAITADFMEDLGLFNADEVANYVAGAYAPPTIENDSQSGAVSFRGLSGSTATRNYFRWYIPSDTYNVERIDFGKGSNSLIFGDVEPGGQAAVFTKRPQMRNFVTVLSQYNSDGAYRFQLDANRRLGRTLALRFNAVRRQERTYQDASTFKLEGETLAATWMPFKNTMIRVEYERGDFDNVRGFGGLTIREQSARSRAFTSEGITYTSDGEWLQRSALPSADRSNGPAGGSPSLLEGGYFDVTMRNAAGAIIGTKRFNGYPKHYNLRGSFDQQSRPFDTYSATIEQRVGPVGFELAYNHQKQTAWRTDNFFSSTISLELSGRPYLESQLDMKNFGNEVDSFRGTAVYKFDKWKWMQQLFVASAEYREDFVKNYRFTYFNIGRVENGSAAAFNVTTDRVRLRVYLDDPQFYSRALFDRMKPANLPVTRDVHAVPLAAFPSGTSPTDGTEWRQAYAGSFSASGNYFGGRIQTLMGLRHDWNRTYEYNGVRTFGRYNEEVPPPKHEDAMPGEYVENKALHLENTSLSGGLTVRLTKGINFYGVYSESFRFQGLRTFDRERFGPITGVTKEVGLKGNFWGDRGNVNLGVFKIDRQNVALSWNGVTGIDFATSEIEDLMNPNNVLPGSPGYKYAEEGTASAARYYRSTENSQGADVTINLRPLKGLQLRFTVAKTKVLGMPDLGSFRGYYEAAVARGNESPALLNEARNLLNSLDIDTKPIGARASPYSASWVVDYAFQRDAWQALRGVRIGLNGSWRDDYLFGISNGQELAGGSTHLVHGYIMRDQKIWRQQVRARLGFRNIVDLENNKIRKAGFTTMVNGANVYRYNYVVPLQVDASLTVRFNLLTMKFTLVGVLLALCVGSLAGAAERPNILFVAVDDLRPEFGAYGASYIKSPNLDRLAKAGMTFDRAYCQQAVCSPTRSSLMTGTRPDTTKVWDLETHFRVALPNVVTLGQHFKNHGYFVQGMGKIYHGSFDDAPTWSVPWQTPRAQAYGSPEALALNQRQNAVTEPDGAPAKKGKAGKNKKQPVARNSRGPAFEGADVPDETFQDGKVAALAVSTLRELSQKKEPFFLAVGFVKPHLPFVSPKKYWDLYDPAKIELAPNKYRPKDAPDYAVQPGGEMRAYHGIPEGSIPDDLARQLKHGYYAAISYMDAQLGKVLDELDRLDLRKNTIVILWGDHGWKLGEHDAWCKHTNTENDTNTALLLSVPGMKHAGAHTRGLVEFVDVYPTLADLAGLPLPAHLEGMSFKPLLDDPKRTWKSAAFSQYPRPAGKSGIGPLMGYSMRTERYRFTVWVGRNDHTKVDAIELYDHQIDPQENTNIANAPGQAELVQQLMAQWKRGWQGAKPGMAAKL